jgi:starch-binding outer membrane protein, SusD/RagB family
MKSMKMIRKVAVVLPMALLFLMPSCDEWLTLEPEDGVIKDNYWTTKEEVYSSVIGCYQAMLTTGMTMRMHLWGDARAEMLIPNNVSSNVQAILDGDITADNAYCSWSLFYTAINQCNTVIDFADQAQETDASFTDAMLLQYQGEAKAIRALMYFYLVRTFRDVPYSTEAIVSDDQSLQIAKSDGDSILIAEAANLESAVKNMASTFGEDAATNKGRFTKIGVFSLLADIYLWLSEYDDCIDNCDKIINSGKVTLLGINHEHLYLIETENGLTGVVDTIYNATESSVDELFNQMYIQGNCDESILELQRESDFPNYDLWTLFYQGGGYFKSNTAAVEAMFFIPSEIDKSWFDLRSDDWSMKSDLIWKYLGTARTGNASLNMRTRATMVANTIVYRLAEIYLMKAEALTQLARANTEAGLTDDANTQLDSAWSLVKAVRLRSNATEMTDMCLDVTKKSDLSWQTMESFIYLEEGRETMFEGKLWFNALRHAKRNDYEDDNLTYLTNLATYAYTASKVTSLQTKLKNHDFHYLPIAKSELETNKALVQNPFYAK